MDKVKEIYKKLDRLLDELDLLEYNMKSVAYILEEFIQTLCNTGSGTEMVLVWYKGYWEMLDKQLREILNQLDDNVMELDKLG